MGPRGLLLADEGGVSGSEGASSIVYRESSASYPPLNGMQQPISFSTLQMQLQPLQLQLQSQSSNGPASQQPLTLSLGSAPSINATLTSNTGLSSGGPLLTQVLLVCSEPTLAAIFRQALSQAPVPSVLYQASTLDLWGVVEQLKKVTGRLSGPDIVFFQPEVLMANPGTVLRLKQLCGPTCPAVVLQGSEPIARALHADDFLPGPTPVQPLRKEDLALMILKWRSRQQVSASSSTGSSNMSGGGASVTSGPIGPLAAATAALQPPLSSTVVSSGASSPKPAQLTQLQALQAQLQVLQQAKNGQQQQPQQKVRSSEIQPAGPPAPGVGVRASPPPRPPPLRLASAGVPPSDTQPDLERALGRSSLPMSGPTAGATLNGLGNISIGSTGGGGRSSGSGGVLADVSELVAQVAELRRKLGDKSRTASMGSVGGNATATAISPTSSLSGGSGLAMPLGSGGIGAVGTAASSLGHQLPSLPSSDLQAQLQSLQQKQQALLQKMAGTGATGMGPGAVALMSGASSGGGATAATSAGNRTRRQGSTPPLLSFGSLARSNEVLTAAVSAAVASGAPPTPAPTPAAQLAGLQLQQQLLQLQQLQLQLQHQQQRLAPVTASGGPAAAAAALPIPIESLQGARRSNTSPTGSVGSLGSLNSSPLPSPVGGAAALQAAATGATSDGGSVSRSNSFVAPGGTRYRPPRQRSPSPLGGVASGHISDTYPGPGTSRFASPQFRSGSGSGAAAAGGAGAGAGGGGSRRGAAAGVGSGHTSDSGASPDFGTSVRDSVRSGPTVLMSKSGDDAIAAALSAASGKFESDADLHRDIVGRVPAGADGGSGSSALADALRTLEAVGDGGSSTDGRSLMDASFALDDSGGGGRGSISGGAASSIDFQPSPVHGSGAAAAPAANGRAARPDGQQQQEQQRSNFGGTRLGSHRLSTSTVQTDPVDEDDQPLRVSAARQSTQAAVRPPPFTAAAAAAGLPGALATGPSKEPRGGGAVATAAAGSGKAAPAAVVKMPPARLPAAAVVPQKPEVMLPPQQLQPPQQRQQEPVAAAGASERVDGPMSGSPVQGSQQMLDIRPAEDGDDVRVASPDSSSQQPQQQPAPRRSQAGGGHSAAIVAAEAASLSARPLRSDSQGNGRLPSIDGTQPLTAAVTRSGAADVSKTGASSSLRRQSSARKAVSDDRRGGIPAAAAVDVAAAAPSPCGGKAASAGVAIGIEVPSNGPSAEASSKPLTGSLHTTADPGPPCPPIGGTAGPGTAAVDRPNEVISLVASIEGSITAGLSRTPSRGVTTGRSPSSAAAAPLGPAGPPYLQRLLPSSSGGRSAAYEVSATASAPAAMGAATGGSYSDDIFAAVRRQGSSREASSPAPLHPPPRSTTPPARRAARILMCSHPIVITREDFLPF